MKILHTSDWHLGHLLYNYDRSEEQEDMLRQIAELVQEHQPDVMVLCGDVFHTAQPSATVQHLLSEALIKIHRAAPEMKIVATAGNHDSGSKHEIFRTPWKELGVEMIGNVERGELEKHIVEIPDKGYVVAVPYCNERNLPEDFYLQLLEVVKERNTTGLPLVLTAHTTVSGCNYKGHDNGTDYIVGGVESVEADRFGTDYDYLALGHIHNEQWVAERIRYCGSPLPVSFDEVAKHSVSLVNIEAHGAQPEVTQLEIKNLHPLVTLPTEGALPWEEVRQLLAEFPTDLPAYIRLKVAIADYLPTDANAQAQALAEGKQCRFCYIQPVREECEREQQSRRMTVWEFQEESPIEIARRYAEDIGKPWDEELAELFNEVVRQVNEEERI